MHTFSARCWFAGRSLLGRAAPSRGPAHRSAPNTHSQAEASGEDTLLQVHASPSDQAGFALIEVMISALLIGLIVIATLNGFDVASRASGSERARAQADALAQQAEDKLRGEPISILEAMEAKSRVESVTLNGTVYTVTSSTLYVSDATATASCNSTATGVGYYRTTSEVSWPTRGTRKPVVETGIVSPPPGAALIVQVTNAATEGVAGMSVTATGPEPGGAPHTLTTAANGCAILALLPGEYTINVSKAGYVDENWYANSEEDLSVTRRVYLTAESAAKEPYSFDVAGTLKVEFTPEPGSGKGDSFVAFNSKMKSPAFRASPFPSTLETYTSTIESAAKVFPFVGSPYSVYAGTCEANNPVAVNPKNSAPPTVTVLPGKQGVAKVVQPPINIKVMSGSKVGKLTEGVEVENATGTLQEPAEPEGCGTIRKFSTIKGGALPHPGMPFGEYTLCVTGGVSGGNNGATTGLAKNRKYTTTFENDTATGPSQLTKMTNGGVAIEESGKKTSAVIYMGAPDEAGKLENGSSCP